MKCKKIHFELLTRSWKIKIFYFKLLIQKIKEQNFDFEVNQDSFTEMKYYLIQNYLKKM